MKIKVSIFREHDRFTLESKMNKFIEEKVYSIVSLSQSVLDTLKGHVIIITLVYREKSK